MRNALILSAAAVAGALILAPAAAAALPAGDYDFNLLASIRSPCTSRTAGSSASP